MGLCEDGFERAGERDGDLDAPDADSDQRAKLEQLQPDRPRGGRGKLRSPQGEAAQRRDQDIGERGEPQPELVGSQGRGRSAIRVEIELALLDAVLHLAARAVNGLVKRPSRHIFAGKRGDDETGIGALGQMLGLGHDAALPAPGSAGLILKFLENPRWLAAFLRLPLSFGQFRRDLRLEPGVARQAEDVANAIGFAPCHQFLAAQA